MNTRQSKIVRQEFGRSAVWLLFSIFGWSVVLTQTQLPQSGALWVGLIAGTVVFMTGITIVLRWQTGETFRSQGDLMFLLTVLVVGMYVVYRWATNAHTLPTYGLIAAIAVSLAVRIVFADRLRMD